MRSNTRLKMSEEMIKYTDKSLGNKLAYVFNQIYDILQENFSLNNEGLASALKAKTEISLNEFIAQVIEEHTNIKTRVLLSSGIPGAIMVFPFNRNHIFLKDVLRDHYFLNDEKRILMESVGSKGSVDLKQGKVSGIFTTYVHALYLDLNLLFKTYGLSGSEVAAIVLHEIGHAFTYYEYSNRLSQTNQLLAQVAREIHSGADKDAESKRVYIFKEIGALMNMDSKQMSEFFNETDKYVLGTKIFKMYVREIGRMHENSKYDETTSEALADNFAVRQGYGKELISGLDKLYRGSVYDSQFTRALFLASELIIDFLIVPALIVAAFMGNPVLGAVYLIAFIYIYVVGSSAEHRDMTYDELKQRYNRIRQGMIGSLKNTDLSKDEVKSILESLDIIDNIIDNTLDYKPISQMLSDIFNPWSIAVNKEITRQQNLEELANNELFVHSSRLKHGL